MTQCRLQFGDIPIIFSIGRCNKTSSKSCGERSVLCTNGFFRKSRRDEQNKSKRTHYRSRRYAVLRSKLNTAISYERVVESLVDLLSISSTLWFSFRDATKCVCLQNDVQSCHSVCQSAAAHDRTIGLGQRRQV